MSIEMLALPRLGETMETGRIAGWLKRPGDLFKRGETIVEIESDKTVVELPALTDGRLVEILADVGSDVDVGAPLCRFENEGEVLAAGKSRDTQPVEAVDPLGPVGTVSSERQRATPVARRIARQNGLSLGDVEGTGRRGRIEARDVQRTAGGRSAADEALASREWQPNGACRGTIVLLHGFGGDAQTWAGLAAGLSRRGWRTIAPDLAGHGATERDAVDLAGLVEAAVGFADSVDGAFELVGHSLGGAVAVAVALAVPRVRRLTLIAPAGLGTEIDADFVGGMASVRQTGVLAHLLRRLAVRPPALSPAQMTAMVKTLGQGRLAALAASMVSEGRQALDIVADLGALPMPTRIVWGLEDRIIPWRHVLQAPSRTAIHLVANAGHMPHWDQPQEVAALFDWSDQD